MKRIALSIILLIVTIYTNGQVQPRLVLPVGHTSDVYSASFSKDCKYVLTASHDGTAKIWEASSGRELKTLRGHNGPVTCENFSPDGKYLLTGSLDTKVIIWESSNGKDLYSLHGHSDQINSTSYSKDGKYILTASNDGTAKIWEASSGRELHNLIGHKREVFFASFSIDGKYVVTASGDSTTKIWDVTSGKLLHSFVHTNSVFFPSFSPDVKYLVTASYNGTAKIWDLTSGRELHSLVGHTEFVLSASFSPDGKYLVSVSEDNTLKIWDVLSGRELHSFHLKTKDIWLVSFSLDGRYLLTSSDDNIARIWDVNSGKELNALRGHTEDIFSASFSTDGNYVLTASEDNTAKIWETSSGINLHNLGGNSIRVSACFSTDGNYVLTLSDSSLVTIWEVSNGKEIFALSGDKAKIYLASLSSNGKRLLTASMDSTIIIRDVSNGKVLHSFRSYSKGHESEINFSSDGKYLIIASEDNTSKIWEVSSGRLLHTLRGRAYASISFAYFSTDGKYLVTSSGDTTAKIWEVTSGRLLHTLQNKSILVSASLSLDGKYLVTASFDNTSKIWEISSGRLLHTLPGGAFTLYSFANFSADGKYVVTNSEDNTVKIWDASSGSELYMLNGHTKEVSSACFSADGKHLLTSSLDNTARIWDLTSGKLILTLSEGFGDITNATYSNDGKIVITTGDNHKTILWDATTGKPLYTRLQLKNNDWLVYDEDYHYDGSPGARDMLYFVCGLEVIELSQMKDALYVPDLAEKIMNGQAINYKKISELDICGTLPLIDTVSKNDKGYHYKITPRKYPLERLELQVNKKNVITILPNKLSKKGNDFYLDLTEKEVSKHFIAGQANLVKLIGVVKEGNTEITTRGVEITSDESSSKSTNPPNLYAVMVGINDYKDENLHLNFPSKDAISLGKSVEQSAKKLLGDDHVFVYNVNTDFKNKQVKVISTPEKEGVRKVLEEIGKKSKPEDIVMIFFAGHGVMQGATDKKFTFLTAEASKDNLVGISTNDLKSWLSPEGPNKMLANKSILIFDACNSGQATKEIAALARNDDESNRKRQVEDLKDKSGMFILAASAPNQSAYELPQYQQGLLTYCLLSTLKNDPNILDENKYLNVQKWFLQTESLLKNTMESLGLVQNAQPYGTANIKIGLVDEGVKNNIQLAKEKPAVLCISAEDKTTEEDGLRLKDKLNAKLMEITSRGIDAPIIYIEKETSSANAIKLKYEVKSGKINCDVIFLKNQKKYNQSSVEGKEVDLDGLIDLIIGMVEKNIK